MRSHIQQKLSETSTTRLLTTTRFIVAAATMTLVMTNTAAAVDLNVKIENLSPSDGFFFTPVWIAAHNGTFDTYSSGQPASMFPGLEELAEEGMTAPISASFASAGAGVDTTITSPGGFAGAPVFDPGEVVDHTFSVANPTTARYFSYASMVIPSNDAFFSNGDPLAHMLFDASGNFTGPLTIEIRGGDVRDAGTEVNDINGGAAFSANGGTSASESANIATHAGLGDFLGTNTAAGTTLASALSTDTLLARITVTEAVPEPATGLLAIVGAAVALLRRRR
ncbi:MAG: spondin domain-containing protein [Pirellulaceae bacterium]|nr:spondin domain-containing protein [Planctomycetales bacterium]